jgi:hypothetical protein
VRFLLDVNVLIALAFPQHVAHGPAHSWFRRERDRLWATCPLTQAGFLRAASRALGGSRDAVRKALGGLERDCQSPHHEYWPVDTDLRDLNDSMRSRLAGPSQIAGLQLLLLAHRHRATLATFDRGVRELVAGTRYENSIAIL